jgi:ABC-type Fe3+ transport system permease subunit
MLSGLLRARRRRGSPRGSRRRIGCFGWLLVLLAVVVLVLLLSVLFGGFQKGTNAGLAHVPAAAYQP